MPQYTHFFTASLLTNFFNHNVKGPLMDFALNFYTTFYLFIGQNPANVFTNFGQQFYTHFYYSDFFKYFLRHT
jgi:hypothetical protein